MNANGLVRSVVGVMAIMGLLAFGSTALAQERDASAGANTRRGVPVWTGYHLKSNPGWSLGLESYAGLGVLADEDGSRGHGLAGGISRVRVSYFEAGGELEVSDLASVRWRKTGGFVGAYLPLVNWVDIDATVGLAQRAYTNPDQRYGSGGLSLKTSALTFRLGFSDRVIDGLFGLRLGAALLFDADLQRQKAHWTYTQPGQQDVSGDTHVGGFSTAVVVTLGFDVAFRR